MYNYYNPYCNISPCHACPYCYKDPFYSAFRQVDLGTRWEVEEGGWRGVWIRRGNSNNFDARWTRPGAAPVTAVLRMEQQGNNVRIERRNSSTGNNCNYTGGIEGSRVTGNYTCDQGGGTWSATIIL